MSFDWKATLGTVAPMLATALGGRLAGLAAKAGLTALGIEPEPGNEEQQLAAAMASATPADLLKLKQADQQFRLDMRKLGVDLARIDAADRNSARRMAKERGIWPQVTLSVVYTVAYGVVLYYFMTGQISVPESQRILFGSLLGFLTAAQTQIFNFWFGSSHGSARKTELLKGVNR